jgi:hypothetical protein
VVHEEGYSDNDASDDSQVSSDQAGYGQTIACQSAFRFMDFGTANVTKNYGRDARDGAKAQNNSGYAKDQASEGESA